MSIKAFIDKDYLIIFLKTLIDVLVFEAKSMIPGIDRCQILTKVICLPPLNEQKLISKNRNFIELHLIIYQPDIQVCFDILMNKLE